MSLRLRPWRLLLLAVGLVLLLAASTTRTGTFQTTAASPEVPATVADPEPGETSNKSGNKSGSKVSKASQPKTVRVPGGAAKAHAATTPATARVSPLVRAKSAQLTAADASGPATVRTETRQATAPTASTPAQKTAQKTTQKTAARKTPARKAADASRGSATKTVRVAYSATPSSVQGLIDRCHGPVAVRYPGVRARLIGEHDYCGGLWVLGLKTGQHVQFTGATGGRYRVNGNIKTVSRGASISNLYGMGDVVAQTCIPGTSQMRLVGLSAA